MNKSPRNSSRRWTSAAARRLVRAAGEPPTVEDAVRVLADRLLDGVTCPPTDLEAVAAKVNVYGFDACPLPFSGELRRCSEGFRIAYSSFLSWERKRFTIAHEIGHAVFETTGRGCPRVGGELERLCDMLAAEILMPQPVFLLHLPPLEQIDLPLLSTLSRRFQASRSSIAIRTAELRGVSVFGVDGRQITWAYGIVRRGSVQQADAALWPMIHDAINGGSGCDRVYLMSRGRTDEWRVEWSAAGEGKALFLLRPVRRQRIADVAPW